MSSRSPYDFIGDIDNATHMHYIARRIGAMDIYQQHSSHSGYAEMYPALACDRHTVDMAAALYGRDAILLGFDFEQAYTACGTHGLSSSPTNVTAV